jgi:peptidoglycan/LPS O-acetylase OafA/YrhL
VTAPAAVDGFFVLTGFLLTFALLDTKPPIIKENINKKNAAPATFSLRQWYYRRVLRLVPLYFSRLHHLIYPYHRYILCAIYYGVGHSNINIVL